MLVINKTVWSLQSIGWDRCEPVKISVSAPWSRYCKPIFEYWFIYFPLSINQRWAMETFYVTYNCKHTHIYIYFVCTWVSVCTCYVLYQQYRYISCLSYRHICSVYIHIVCVSIYPIFYLYDYIVYFSQHHTFGEGLEYMLSHIHAHTCPCTWDEVGFQFSILHFNSFSLIHICDVTIR